MVNTLQVTTRSERGKQLARLRAQGKVPAVMYGPKEEATPITLSRIEFDKVFREAGESTVITLSGLGEEKDVLVQDIAHDPVTGAPLHVDFYAIEKGKKVTVHVPIEFTGEAPVVKAGGVLTKVLHELEIEAMPKDLPHEIMVDVSTLVDFDSHITVAQVQAPAGVTILNDAEEMVVVVAEAKEEAEEPVAQIDMDSIEVEAKGKREEEGEAAPDAA